MYARLVSKLAAAGSRVLAYPAERGPTLGIGVGVGIGIGI